MLAVIMVITTVESVHLIRRHHEPVS